MQNCRSGISDVEHSLWQLDACRRNAAMIDYSRSQSRSSFAFCTKSMPAPACHKQSCGLVAVSRDVPLKGFPLRSSWRTFKLTNVQGIILLQLRHDFCPLALATTTSLLTVIVSGCYYLVYANSQIELRVQML